MTGTGPGPAERLETGRLTTERLTLRRPDPRDAEAAAALHRSERSRHAGGHVPRVHAFGSFAALLGHWEIRGFGLWAVTLTGDDRAVGLVGPHFPDGWPETEISWVLFKGAEGMGLADETARAAIADPRTRLGWGMIVHYIAPENARSVALAERLGARLDPQAAVPKPEAPCLGHRRPGGRA